MSAAPTPIIAPSTGPIPRAVILAGGRGLRAHPYTTVRNKCLFSVHDQMLIEQQIGIARDQLGIREFIVLVGHLKDQVQGELGDGARHGVKITYVTVTRIEDGPAMGLMEARAQLDGAPFLLMLGDEYHHNAHHRRILDALARQPDSLFTYTRTINPNQIRANFSLDLDADSRVRGIIEKPERLVNDLCGCGTLYLTPKIFTAIEQAKPSPRSGRIELFETAAALPNAFAVDIDDPDYVNMNTLDDFRRAVFTYRAENFSKFKISVVIPAWNESQSIGYVVKDFLNRPEVDEVLVMDNLSPDGTGEVARAAGARVISDRLKGYGDAIHKGLNAATGDILVIVEADYTFRAADLPKLLEYLKDAAMVIGTRTTRQLIAQAANMDWHARLGNIVMAKYMEVLWFWLETRFTDVGCTYRAIWRNDWQSIEPHMHMDGPGFSVEMMVEMMKTRKVCVEVPVNYYPRFGGESKHSGNLAGLTKTAWKMWKVITGRWFETVKTIIENWAKPEA